MSEFNELIDLLKEFRDERDWKKFHNPKDLSIAISIESSELLEIFLWKENASIPEDKVREELADIFCFAFLLLDYYQLDIKEIIKAKIEANRLKYPIQKSKGIALKYNEI